MRILKCYNNYTLICSVFGCAGLSPTKQEQLRQKRYGSVAGAGAEEQGGDIGRSRSRMAVNHGAATRTISGYVIEPDAKEGCRKRFDDRSPFTSPPRSVLPLAPEHLGAK